MAKTKTTKAATKKVKATNKNKAKAAVAVEANEDAVVTGTELSTEVITPVADESTQEVSEGTQEASTEVTGDVDKDQLSLDLGDEVSDEVSEDDTDAEDDNLVRDGHGNPVFKRMVPNAATETPKKKRVSASYKARERQEQYKTTANAALITFPTDRWGITKDLKKAMIHTASRVAGDENKLALAKETLSILVDHLDAKFKADSEYKAKLAARDKKAKESDEE